MLGSVGMKTFEGHKNAGSAKKKKKKNNNKKKKKTTTKNTGSVGLAETQVFFCLPYTVCKVRNKREA